MLLLSEFVLPSPSLPACSAAPPGRILDNTLSPSMPGWPAAALPIPPGLGAALEPGHKNRERKIGRRREKEERERKEREGSRGQEESASVQIKY